MFVSAIQTPEEAQEPRGFIIFNKPTPVSIAVFKWNNFLSEKVYDHSENKPNVYLADDGLTELKIGFCRCCKQKITPYKETYYKKTFEYSDWNSWEYNQTNGYCKKCAIEQTKEVLTQEYKPVWIVKQYAYTWTDWLGTRTEWSDGAISETDTKSIKEAQRN